MKPDITDKRLLKFNFEKFFFSPVNPRYVGIFRIALAVILCLGFKPISRFVPLFENITQIEFLTSLYPEIFLTHEYWYLITAILVIFAAGVKTRLAGILLFVLLVPLLGLKGADESRQILLFTLLIFLFINNSAGFGLLKKRTKDFVYDPIWPIRIIQLQLSAVYGINAVYKTTPEYLGGEVLQYLSHMPTFLVDLSSGYWDTGFVKVPVWILAVFTVATEYFLAAAFWFRRTRYAAVFIGLSFHFALTFFIKINFLHWATVFLYLSFLLPFEKKK